MTRLLALLAAFLALSGCVSLPTLNDGITLSVHSYDRATGVYVLELRNNTARPILYLDPYLNFDTTRLPDSEPSPKSPKGVAFMVHDTKLAPGESVTLTGECTATGACAKPGIYVAVRACWFTNAFTCKQYLPIWSETALNGA